MASTNQVAKWIGRGLNTVHVLSPSLAGKLAMRLFITPLNKRVRPKELAFLKTATKSDFNYEGDRLTTYHWGKDSDPLVVFLHGWESGSGRWRYYIPTLVEQGYQVAAIDAPAHGSSSGKVLNLPLYKRMVTSWIKTLPPIYAIVGHSLGAATSLIGSLSLPDVNRPKKVVSLASFAHTDSVFQDYMKTLGLKPAFFELLMREALKLAPNEPFSTFQPVLRVTEFTENTQGLIVHDRKDEITSINSAHILAENWPSATLFITEDYGHSLQSQEVTDKVLDFITFEN